MIEQHRKFLHDLSSPLTIAEHHLRKALAALGPPLGKDSPEVNSLIKAQAAISRISALLVAERESVQNLPQDPRH